MFPFQKFVANYEAYNEFLLSQLLRCPEKLIMNIDSDIFSLDSNFTCGFCKICFTPFTKCAKNFALSGLLKRDRRTDAI